MSQVQILSARLTIETQLNAESFLFNEILQIWTKQDLKRSERSQKRRILGAFFANQPARTPVEANAGGVEGANTDVCDRNAKSCLPDEQ